MKIFEFKFDGHEVDWVIANDELDAIKAHKKDSGNTDFSNCKISELPKEQWATTYLLDPDDTYFEDEDNPLDEDEYCNGCKIIETFASYAQGCKTAHIIATSEY